MKPGKVQVLEVKSSLVVRRCCYTDLFQFILNLFQYISIQFYLFQKSKCIKLQAEDLLKSNTLYS